MPKKKDYFLDPAGRSLKITGVLESNGGAYFGAGEYSPATRVPKPVTRSSRYLIDV